MENYPLKKIEDPKSIGQEDLKAGASKARNTESRWKDLNPSEDSQLILASKIKKSKPMSQSVSVDNLMENFSLGNKKISESKIPNNFEFDKVIT